MMVGLFISLFISLHLPPPFCIQTALGCNQQHAAFPPLTKAQRKPERSGQGNTSRIKYQHKSFRGCRTGNNFTFSHFTRYLKSTTTSKLQKTPPRLHCEMETRVMCGSQAVLQSRCRSPASLPPTKFLSAPSGATGYGSAPAPRAPRLAAHLGSTQRPDPAQKLAVLHRGPAKGGWPRWPYTI